MNTYLSMHADGAEPLTIQFDQPPIRAASLEAQRQTFLDHATLLAEVLSKHLPAGLLDHLTAVLLMRKAALFVVGDSFPLRVNVDRPGQIDYRDRISFFAARMSALAKEARTPELAQQARTLADELTALLTPR